MRVEGLAFEMVLTEKEDFKLCLVGDNMNLFSGDLKRLFRDYLF